MYGDGVAQSIYKYIFYVSSQYQCIPLSTKKIGLSLSCLVPVIVVPKLV